MKIVKSKYVGKAPESYGKKFTDRKELIKDSLDYLPFEVVNGDILLLSEQVLDGYVHSVYSAGYEVPSFPKEVQNLVNSLSGAVEANIWVDCAVTFHFIDEEGNLDTDYLGSLDESDMSFYDGIGYEYGVETPDEFMYRISKAVKDVRNSSKYSIGEIIVSKSEDDKKYIGYSEFKHENECVSIVNSELEDNPWDLENKEYLLTIFY